jgi:hypothetical protein
MKWWFIWIAPIGLVFRCCSRQVLSIQALDDYNTAPIYKSRSTIKDKIPLRSLKKQEKVRSWRRKMLAQILQLYPLVLCQKNIDG